MMPNAAIRHSCSRRNQNDGGAEERGRRNAIVEENRADEQDQKKALAKHHQTKIQKDDPARMVETEELLAGSRIMVHSIAKPVPIHIAEFHHDAGRVVPTTASDDIELLSSRPPSTSSLSFSLFLPTLGSKSCRTLPGISTGLDNSNEKECHSHVKRDVCEDMPCQENKLKKQLALSISSCHPPAEENPPSNDDDTPMWFERQQLTLAADPSFLYLPDELSSLSDNEENNRHTKAPDEEPTSTYGNGNPSHVINSKHEEGLHLLGHSRHKSLVGSEIASAAAVVTNSPIDAAGPRHVAQGDFCNETRHQLTFFFKKMHDSSRPLDNHGDRKRKAGDHDSFASASSCLTLSTSSLFGGLDTAPTNKKASSRNTAAKSQTNKQDKDNLQNDEQGTHDTNSRHHVTQETRISFLDMQPKESHCGQHHHRPRQPTIILAIQDEQRPSQHVLVLGSKIQTKNITTTTTNHDADHSSVYGKVTRLVTEDPGDHGAESSVRPPPLLRPTRKTRRMMTSHDRRAKSHDESDNDEKNSSGEKEEEEEKVQKTTDQSWQTHFQELVEYKTQHGHCNVPFCYNQNLCLAAWVKRQRYQYKCKIRGKHSHLTDERERLLEQLGFVWDSHVAAWEEKFSLMAEFYKQNGHCCIPVKQKELSDWVKRQRRHYKQYVLLRKSKLQSATTTTATMSEDRIRRLNEIKFQWAPMTTNQYTAKKKKKDEGAASSRSSKKRRPANKLHR